MNPDPQPWSKLLSPYKPPHLGTRRSVLDKARHGCHVTQKDVGEGEAARLHEGGGEGGLAQAPHLVTPNVEAGAGVNLHHLLTCKASRNNFQISY
jgi:hypothetical protein